MQSTATTNRLLLNTVTNCVRLVFSLGLLILLTPFILEKVGESDFGLWSLVFAVLGFFGLLDLGFGTGVVKFVAACSGSGDYELRNRILSTTAVVYLGITALSLILAWLGSLFFNDFFTIPDDQQNKAFLLFWIIGCRVAFLAIPLSLFRGVLFGDQRIYVVNLVQTGSQVLYGLGAWWGLEQGLGIVGLALINLASMIVEYALYVFLAYRSLADLEIRWSLVDKSLIREITSFSSLAFIPQVAALVLMKTDPVIVKLFLPLSAVAVYAVGLKVAENVHMLIKQFVNVFTPVAAEMGGRRDTAGIQQILIKGTKFSMVPAIVVTVAAMLHAENAIIVWIGPHFTEAALVAVILTLSTLVSVPQLLASTVLMMTGYQRLTAWAAGVSAVLNIVISLILVVPLGLAGVALGTLISTLIVDVFLVVNQACRTCNVAYRDYVRRGLLPLLIPGVAQVGVSVALIQFWPATSLLGILVNASLGGLFFALFFWLLGTEESEKEFVRKELKAARRYLPARFQKEAAR